MNTVSRTLALLGLAGCSVLLVGYGALCALDLVELGQTPNAFRFGTEVNGFRYSSRGTFVLLTAVEAISSAVGATLCAFIFWRVWKIRI